ncbi:hypothetical protein [Dactylosporangium sp. NPDC051484]|uniref:hypothetical protein n=1 Tax=Dactylosporangium sp. NPDC051484 TaxID=3154942 RepID=UPI00344DE90B
MTVLIKPAVRGARREAILAAARAGNDLTVLREAVDERGLPVAHVARVVEYDIPDRAGNGTGELIVLLSTIGDPGTARADELAEAYHCAGNRKPETTSSRPTCAGRAVSCAHGCRTWSCRRSGPGSWSTTPSRS